MKPRDDLHRLIQTLSKSEKRSFKLFAERYSKKEGNNYLKLFAAIEKQKEYDEGKLLRKFDGDALARNFASTKYQLSNLIIKNLCTQQAGKSVDSELREQQECIDVLTARGLTDLARRSIDKARQLAERYDKHLVLHELLARELTMMLSWQTSNIEQEIERISRSQQSAMTKLSNEAAYEQLLAKITALQKIYPRRDRNAEHQSSLDNILLHPLLQHENRALSFKAKDYFYRIKALGSIINGDRVGEYHFHKQLIELWDSNQAMTQAFPDRKKIALINFLNSCFNLERFNEIEPILQRIRSLPSNSLRDEHKTAGRLYFIDLLYCLHYGLFQRGLNLVAEIEAYLQQHSNKLPSSGIITLHFNVTILWFLQGDYSQTLAWLEKILALTQTELRKDIQEFARILLLIVHWELGNSDLLDSLIRSAYRYLHRRDQLDGFERNVLFYLHKVSNSRAEDERKRHFAALKHELEQIDRSATTGKILGLTEVLFWLESKLQDCSISELYMQKIAEREERSSEQTDNSESDSAEVCHPAALNENHS